MSHLTKRAKKTLENKPLLEHEIVFEWCVQGASSMLKAMKPRYQKVFLRKLGDQVKFNGMDQFSKAQSAIEKTLEKIHDKLLSKTEEAGQLINKYKTMMGKTSNEVAVR